MGQAISVRGRYAEERDDEGRRRRRTGCRVGESGPDQPLSDEALVRATLAGERGADDALARRYYPRVLVYLTRQLGDRERARDLTQDAFYSAFRELRQLRTPRLFAAWLYRIVAATVADAYRRQQRAPPTLSLERLPTPPATEPPDLTRLLVSQALAALAPGDRTILVMDGVWGLSEREIATALGLSRDAAHQRLRRAKQRFRARYPGGDA